MSAVSRGTARVVARLGLAADSANIVVRDGNELIVTPDIVSISQGDQLQLEVGYADPSRNASGQSVEWKTSDASIATVSTDGVVSALGAGDVTLTASIGSAEGTASLHVKPSNVASVLVRPANSSITVGENAQLSATLLDDYGRALPALSSDWSSSNSSIVAVDDRGVVRGLVKGSAIITAKYLGRRGSATVNVLATPVASVAVSLPAASIAAGQAVQAAATLTASDGSTLTNRVVAWQSSNPAVATVNAEGTIVGIIPGNVTISAISEGKVGNAGMKVEQRTAVSVSVSPPSPSAVSGQSVQLSASARDAMGTTLGGKTFTWTSSNPAVATVSSSGMVTTLASGTTSITAATDGVSGSTTLTVTSVPVSSVNVLPSSAQIPAGATLQLSTNVTLSTNSIATDRVVAWKSANPTVATVSSSGLVTGVSTGATTITVTVDGVSATAAIGVAAPPPAPVSSITIILNSPAINMGQSTQAQAILRDASGNILSNRAVTWSSNDPTLATVNTSGLVSGVAAGTATIVATSEGKTASATVTINATAPAPVASITLSAPTTSLTVGATAPISVTLKDAAGNVLSGRTITWSTSNATIASVSASGTCTGVGSGSATITVKSEGKQGTIGFTVSSTTGGGPVASIAVVLNKSSLTLGQTAQASATARDAAGAVIAGAPISWHSSNASVVAMSQAGVATAVSTGSATIIAMSGTISGQIPVSVSNAAAGPVASVSVSLTSSSISVGQGTSAIAVARDASGTVVGGAQPTWSISAGAAVATISSSGAITGVSVGTATVAATINGFSGSATLNVTTAVAVERAAPATLPNARVDVTMPSGSRQVRVAAGADLQAALNAAAPGDELLLANGAVFTGNFRLPAKSCGSWIIVRAENVPVAAGQRMRPSLAGTLPTLRTPNGQTALETAPGACKWRLIGLNITHVSPLPVEEQYGLINFGEGDASTPSADIILDRVYVHAATSSGNVRRGVGLNGVRQAVIDSWISEIHALGTDSQAIAGWGGAGPYLIRNNYLEGAGENIIFGGADPAFDGLVPSDIEIIGNHFFKPMSWKGSQWQVKNLLELKNAQRVLIEGNVFQNNWAAAQDGWAFIWASHNQYGGSWGAWTVVKDVTFRYNRVDNVEGVFNLAERYEPAAVSGSRMTITHNLITNVGFSDSGDLDRLYLLSGNLPDITIEHNTGFAPTGFLQIGDQSPNPKPRLTFRNNLGGNALYTFNSPLGDGKAMFTAYGVPLAAVAGSCVVTSEGYMMPDGNTYPTSISAVGVMSPTGMNGNYRLGTSSPCRGKATDGTDPGVDMSSLEAKTAGVVTPP